MAKKIKLSKGGFTLVDNNLFEKLNKYKWYDNGNGYVATAINGKKILLHRFILNVPDNIEVDHIDNDPKNNLTQNLRIVTQSQNLRNQKRMQVNIPDGYMTITESALKLGVSKSQIYYYIKIGLLNKYKSITRPLIKKEELIEILKPKLVEKIIKRDFAKRLANE